MVTIPLEVLVASALLSVSMASRFARRLSLAVALSWTGENGKLAVARQVLPPSRTRVPGIATGRRYLRYSLQTPTLHSSRTGCVT
jgi:hypothetical protein